MKTTTRWLLLHHFLRPPHLHHPPDLHPPHLHHPPDFQRPPHLHHPPVLHQINPVRERSTSGKHSTPPAQDKSSERERSTSGKHSTPPAQGSSQRRRKWSEEEVQAVEKTLNSFIRSRRVPGKADCVRCIEESPQALQDRSWTAVKFYVKNRIDAAKRGR
ncbi:uncharacterized protein LOC125905786 isoform X2 [Epinephelus fuscoguttatus]|uniref:uncharacterized protein LOC125905786 isoform X2 n=1 Tax=Epinephelus fuscoguttatus TaxID=293821 RepID=UPI0020D1DC54|nr:uncharacterized protein LOC125905786 isoform X2 [Epinephelus fuscoguttatus]